MRKVFIDTLFDLAAHDDRIILLTGDLGYTVLEDYRKRFPRRFINVGVAEQNMVGLSVGLAEAGYLPFVYSIAPFAVLRPYEFIRNGAVHQHHPLRIIGVGGGFAYGTAGPSHYALEDYAVMRTLPSMMTLVPADSPQTAAMLRATYNLPSPIYYRIDKNDRLIIPELEGRFSFDHIEVLGTGSDALLIAVGSITATVVSAMRALKERQIMVTTAVISTLNPPPTDALRELLQQFEHVISVEEHYITGGLGSLISEVIAENALGNRLIRMGVKQLANGIVGSEHFLRAYHGLSQENIVETVTTAISRQI